jgi:arginyl-tRNA synthetase
MNIYKDLDKTVKSFLKSEFSLSINKLEFQSTKKEFIGDITLVIFPLVKVLKTSLDDLGKTIGSHLINFSDYVIKFNLVKGFLNLTISDQYFIKELYRINEIKNYGFIKNNLNSALIIVEFSSPNTNKPLHLGHIRNNLLGHSVSKILEANGKRVLRTQIINDRGIHICKSMIAWKLFSNNKTPESIGVKGDQFVGKYYVKYNEVFKKQVINLIDKGKSEDEAMKSASIFIAAQKLLRLWESGDKSTRKLWKKMNNWVYDGFDMTYNNLGVFFDSLYYESDTYLLGKKIIEEGLSKDIFFKKEDGSIWVDLTKEGLDEKLLLRSDGTSVYITQDLGTASKRIKDFPELDGMVYTVGNEQDYHFKVLYFILKKLGHKWSDSIFHLSYGMVDLPDGKMKSREGNVIDADQLIHEMEFTAKKVSESMGKIDGMTGKEQLSLFKTIGMGALKYHILKVDPKKRILFDPEKSIDFNGNTGPFIQYTFARIKSLLRNFENSEIEVKGLDKINYIEKNIVKHLLLYPDIIYQAGKLYSPALIANYVYDLVKYYNTFYQNVSIIGTKDISLRNFRIKLSEKVSDVIFSGCSLLGIEVPEKM